MAGRHGPPSQTTFYLSLATAALRGLLVVAALALGFFVLSKAFPTGGTAEPVTPTGPVVTTPPTSPSPATSPTRRVPQLLDPSQVSVQVLNGTNVSGLAAETADLLEQAGYDIRTIDDAPTSYDVTTIHYVPKRKADAEALAQAFFPTAVLEIAEDDLKVDVTVNIGEDYAETVAETPAEEAT